MKNIENWKTLFGKEEQEQPEKAEEFLDRITGSWDKSLAYDFGAWDKVIELREEDGYNFWLVMKDSGSWCLYRSKIK
ncbi:hypothetical protein LCGC14_2410130 [marine sediment metagenome]|uniref:Uncharacterized protein n=1 Tax=marine sediment metagenome TaxID=412755 RepID=A0A0F9EM68_9ZZZZ